MVDNVRAQTIWKGINRRTNEFRGFNIIFIDDQNCRIHAFIGERIASVFVERLKEGQIYTVSNFKVRTYEGDETNKALRTKKHIYFEYETKFEPLKEDNSIIDKYSFDLFALEDVDKLVTDNRFLIDVIGIVDTPNPNCVFSKEDNKKSHIKFKITDGRQRVSITFFNDVAVSFEKAFKEIAEEQVVIIIASAKVNKYDGEIGLTNYPATRFYLKPDHYSVKELENSFTLMDVEDQNDTKLYTIEEIKNLKENYIEKDVSCQVIVKKVEEKYNWYDNVCSHCDEEVNLVDKRYRCTKCKRNIPYPEKRFRLCTICSDSTGVLAIVFPDDEIERIIGKNVFEIENDDNQAGEGIMFPPLLKEFEKKEYVINLSISKENINKSCKVYKSTKISHVALKLGDHSPHDELSHVVPEISMNAESEFTDFPRTFSPPTEKSTNKTKPRKSKASMKCDLDENTPFAKLMKS
ncbi:hypothetical protein POM88_053298 [Heracleum sosnowskyi]|uniref:Replication factor A C-terminal domain-containing protein n=1 Tax=Heracleum sosnowskyi TaxID=360622 RepID=A0AAD8GPZ1_9APIA|nr:hypothetical protein POM88_053298 [Heracleum sosnowskyi]